jgi:hypothetical protein
MFMTTDFTGQIIGNLRVISKSALTDSGEVIYLVQQSKANSHVTLMLASTLQALLIQQEKQQN